MSSKDTFEKLARDGDQNAIKLIGYTYSAMTLSSMHFDIVQEVEKFANHFGLDHHTDKDAISKLKFNSSKLHKSLTKKLEDDIVAETFGDKSERLQDILFKLVFMNEEDLLKMDSYAKILTKK